MLKNRTILNHLKPAYDDYLDEKKRQSARLNSLTAIFLSLNLAILHFWLSPSSFQLILALASFAIFSFIGVFFLSYQPSFNRFYHIIVPIGFLIPSFVIESIVYFSLPTELSYYVSFSSLLVLIMTMYSWTHLSPKAITSTTILITVGLIVSILLRQESNSHSVILILATNLFFLGAAIISGIVSKLMRDDSLKESFLLQQSLQTAIKDKTKEAEKYEFYSNHDQLTGLSNRRFAKKNFNKKLSRAKCKNDTTFALLFLDLNHFKKINDTYGHEAGDEVLRITAERLKRCIRDTDNLVRLGGDEFLICLETNESNDLALFKFRDKIKACISAPIKYTSHTFAITTSIGISHYPKDGETLEALIKSADENMYTDKQHAKNILINTANLI